MGHLLQLGRIQQTQGKLESFPSGLVIVLGRPGKRQDLSLLTVTNFAVLLVPIIALVLKL